MVADYREAPVDGGLEMATQRKGKDRDETM